MDIGAPSAPIDATESNFEPDGAGLRARSLPDLVTSGTDTSNGAGGTATRPTPSSVRPISATVRATPPLRTTGPRSRLPARAGHLHVAKADPQGPRTLWVAGPAIRTAALLHLHRQPRAFQQNTRALIMHNGQRPTLQHKLAYRDSTARGSIPPQRWRQRESGDTADVGRGGRLARQLGTHWHDGRSQSESGGTQPMVRRTQLKFGRTQSSSVDRALNPVGPHPAPESGSTLQACSSRLSLLRCLKREPRPSRKGPSVGLQSLWRVTAAGCPNSATQSSDSYNTWCNQRPSLRWSEIHGLELVRKHGIRRRRKPIAPEPPMVLQIGKLCEAESGNNLGQPAIGLRAAFLQP